MPGTSAGAAKRERCPECKGFAHPGKDCPRHLLSGTSQDNADDMVARGRSNRGERHWNWKNSR
jgi:hypothetical protein